ncbi:hypothetical protein HMPREF9504_02165, partial [Enterococcus faecalis TX0102]
ESCCLEWYQNVQQKNIVVNGVLESCCLEWYQNAHTRYSQAL